MSLLPTILGLSLDYYWFATLEPKSVKKKLKDKAFAAKVDREIIRSSVESLGVDFDQHIQFVIDALKPHAEEHGIAGKKIETGSQ